MRRLRGLEGVGASALGQRFQADQFEGIMEPLGGLLDLDLVLGKN